MRKFAVLWILAVSSLFAQQRPVINASGIVDAATYRTNLAAGGIASVFGTNLAGGIATSSVLPLPLTLLGTSLTLDGVPAPLFYVSPSQINFQVPWEFSSRTQAAVVVNTASGASAAQTITILRTGPGVFSTDGSGSGQGAITISATGQLATPANPVSRGAYITIYCTGLGAVTNTPATGAIALASPPSSTISSPVIFIGGQPSNAQFVGLAPGYVGLYQVNVIVPFGVATGPAVPVTVELSSITSSVVTIGVQ